MQIAARLPMSATATAVTAATAAAKDAAATEPAADAEAGGGFGALLAAALSGLAPDTAPDTAPGDAMPVLAGAAVKAEAGSEDSGRDSAATLAEPTSALAPELMLQALLTGSPALAAAAQPQPQATDADTPPLAVAARTADGSLPASDALNGALEEAMADRLADASADLRQRAVGRNDAHDARQAHAASLSLAGETAAAAKPSQPFAEALRRPDREPDLGIAAPAATTQAAAATELPAAQAVRHVSAPLSSARWEQALGEQLLWVARKELQTASLTLNPPELGPVRVELQLSDTQAIASFSSQLPEVRKAIEDALPALKTLFADAGLQLQQANVGSGDAGHQSAHRRQVEDGSGGAPRPDDDAPASVVAATALARASNRLLDTFA